jgi:multidrug efflux pump
MGISVSDIAQTLQLALSGQRFSYFNIDGKQYQVIGQFERDKRNETLDLKSIYVKNKTGEMMQLDNVVNMEEQSNPPQLYPLQSLSICYCICCISSRKNNW